MNANNEGEEMMGNPVNRKRFVALAVLGGTGAFLKSAPQAHAQSTLDPAYRNTAQTFTEINTFNKDVRFKAGPWRDVKAFGALGDGVTPDQVAIQAAIDAPNTDGTVGHTVYFPPGKYKITAPVSLRTGVNLVGAGPWSSRISANGDALQCSALVSNVDISSLTIGAVGGHVFFTSDLAGFRFCSIRRCTLICESPDKSVWHQDGDEVYYLHNVVDGCELYQPINATVPAWYMKDKSGNLSCNVWRDCILQGRLTSQKPFFYIENSNSVNFAYDNSFENICCEQNAGGFLHAFSVCNLLLKNISVMDASSYADSLIYIGRAPAPANGLRSRSITIIGYGRRGGSLASGKYDINCPVGEASDVTLMGCNHSSTTPVVNISTNSAGNGILSGAPIATSSLKINEGAANARMGIVTLVGGAKDVLTSAIADTSRVLLTSQSDGGTPGFLRVSSRTAGIKFRIQSSSAADTSSVAWMIVDPV